MPFILTYSAKNRVSTVSTEPTTTTKDISHEAIDQHINLATLVMSQTYDTIGSH